MTHEDFPDGFVLSEAALYSFKDQDVYPDIVSFAAAIPPHLRPLFLIPIKLDFASPLSTVASRIASQYSPSGNTEESDLFGTRTFVDYDNEPIVPQSSPGSIFDIDNANAMTHQQDGGFEENIQSPTDTSYNSDVDLTYYWDYPYRSKEIVRHSSELPIIIKLAIQPVDLTTKTEDKIKKNAKKCSVSLISYDKRSKVFNFSVDAGNGPKNVKAGFIDPEHVVVKCNCKFWQYGGPEYNAKKNDFLMDSPYGTATPPDHTDPDRKNWLCKHAYATLIRIDDYVSNIKSESEKEESDDELMAEIDAGWEKLSSPVDVQLPDPSDNITFLEYDDTPEIEITSEEDDSGEYDDYSGEDDISEEDNDDYSGEDDIPEDDDGHDKSDNDDDNDDDEEILVEEDAPLNEYEIDFENEKE